MFHLPFGQVTIVPTAGATLQKFLNLTNFRIILDNFFISANFFPTKTQPLVRKALVEVRYIIEKVILIEILQRQLAFGARSQTAVNAEILDLIVGNDSCSIERFCEILRSADQAELAQTVKNRMDQLN